MNISDAGLALIKAQESCRLIAYWDAKGKVWTIGWGHTGADVYDGLAWSQDKADSTLIFDTGTAQECIDRCVTVALTQGQFDALCDFVYNLGCTAFATSTMRKLLEMEEYALAAGQFPRFCHAGGVVDDDLLKRRLAEQALFIGKEPE